MYQKIFGIMVMAAFLFTGNVASAHLIMPDGSNAAVQTFGGVVYPSMEKVTFHSNNAEELYIQVKIFLESCKAGEILRVTIPGSDLDSWSGNDEEFIVKQLLETKGISFRRMWGYSPEDEKLMYENDSELPTPELILEMEKL